MQKDRTLRVMVVVAICIATLGLTIAYAAYSQTLTIQGSATVKGNTWSVLFQNPTTPVVSGNAASTANSSVSGSTTFNFDVTFYEPGDSATFKVDVANTGILDAKVSAVTISGVPAALQDYITYSVVYDADDSAVAVNDTLNASQTRTLKITVTYNSNATIPNADITATLGLTGTITYVQA